MLGAPVLPIRALIDIRPGFTASGARGKRGFGCPNCVKKHLPVWFAGFERQPATWIVIFDDGLGFRVGLFEELDDIVGMVNDMFKPSIDLCAREGAIYVAQQTPAAAQLTGDLLDREEFGDTVAALLESPIDRMTDYGRPSVTSPAISRILPFGHRNAQRSWLHSS
jgi:hypothetical protein